MSKEIAFRIITNVEQGKEKLNDLKKAVEDYVSWAAQQNREVFNEMPNEESFFAVCKELADIALPDEMLVEKIKNSVPFWVKPFVGLIVKQVKRPTFKTILELLDKHLLDKHISPDWYMKLRELAIK